MRNFPALLAATVAASCAANSPQTTPDRALDSLVDEYFERELELSPMNATSIGDARYDDRLDESTSPGYREAGLALERAYLDRAHAIDATRLSAAPRLTYDIFLAGCEQALAGQSFHEEYLPFNQMSGLPMDLAVYGSGSGPQPFATV